ncbi:MAG: AMP-binding protein, partial [Legionellaceae bacterium]|nr:AMP-binding protein [Legionellaceae bacterium]
MMYRLLKNNVECHPDAIAIVTSDLVKHSYTAVHKKVHQWANYFLQHGIGVGDRVAVLLDNEDHHLFIFLALDRINACYVPFDTDIPKQQLSADILTLDLKKFIIEEVLVPDFNVDPSIQLILSLEKLAHINAYDNHEPVQTYNENADEKTSYILASSGSTGHKNWIPILGSGLLYWARVKKEQFGDSPVRNILITRSPAYDARIAEYICAFSMGGTLHFLNRRQRKDILSIIKACEKPPIDCLLFIASQLTNDQVEKNLSDLQCHGLKHLMVTGDACTPFLKQVCEQLNIKLWNCYGPTEATLGLSMLCVNNLPLIQGTVPIGPPFGNEVHYHLLENNILCIESPYLTEGYLNTSSGNSPFQWIVTERGKIRVFNTGDLFYEQDGLLCYQGRASFESHCKINGVKVTPLIIEQCIHEYTNGTPNEPIQAAVVIKNYLGRLKPFAYLVINPDFNQSLFLIYLKGRLKKEEFPILVCIDELPRLYPSQKIDRKKLIAQQDNPDHFFFNQGQGYRKKFSNDGQGINEERLIAITLKLSDFHSIELMSYQEVATLLNEAVLCSNYIDQQNDQYNFAPMQREQRVLSLLENAYQTLITIYPCIDFFTQEIPSLQKLFALPFPILSATAQLLHYFGKALRYRHPDHAIDIRIKMFETSIAIVQFLDEHVEESARAEVDPNYFTARQLTYNLPIIYMLRQKGNFQHAIEKCQEQLKLAHSDDNQFHVIQALVQLSESYAASQQFELAFEHASAAFKLTDNEAGKYSILYFNAITRLMLAAHQKQDLPLAMQLAQSVVAITQISCIALKTHHLQAAKKILSGTNDHRLQAVEKIWQELFQY